MKTATFVKQVKKEIRQEVNLYKLDPPMDYRYYNQNGISKKKKATYVVVSAINNAFDTGRSETYIFPSDSSGKITSWGELEGSFQGGFDHTEALERAGYRIIFVK